MRFAGMSLHVGSQTPYVLWRQALCLFRDKTSRDTAWVLGGNLINRGLGLLSFGILTRVLGPEEYGVLSIALLVLSMAGELSDLGINASTIRYGAQYAAQKDWDSLRRLYSVVLRSRLVVCAVVFVIGMLISAPLADSAFKKPELTPYLILAFGGVFSTLLNSAFVAILQANQQFSRTVLVNSVYGAVSLGGIALLWAGGALTPYNALIVYLLAPLGATAVAYAMIPRGLVTLRWWDNKVAGKVFHFGKWMSLWAVAAIIQSRLDAFMLTGLNTTTAVGYFNAAFRIATLAQLIPGAYGTVLTPKIASIGTRVELHREFNKSLVIALGLAGTIAAGSLLAPWIVPLLTGDKYGPAIPILQVLLWGMAFFTLNLPFGSTLYALEKSQVFALTAFLQTFATFISDLLLIPLYGAMGAAITFTLTQLLAVLVCSVVVLTQLRTRKT